MVGILVPSPDGDDTAQLQRALDECTHSRKPCTLRLAAGVFHTDVLLVEGFNGSITGAGERRTIVQPLTDRALRSAPEPFTVEPTLAEPYPVLLHFAGNSNVAISDLTLDFPAEMTVSPYTVPYYDPSIVFTQALVAAILVDGDRGAALDLRRVTITGVHNDSFDGSNLSSGVRFEGRTRYIGGVSQQQIMQGGQLEVSDSRIQGTGFGIQTLWGNALDVRLTNNTLDARIYAFDFVDLGASTVSVLHNTIDAELDGVVVFLQNPELAPLAPSRFVIAQNDVRVNASGGAVELDPTGGYAGISVFDFAALSDPPTGYTFTSDVTILNNDIDIGIAPVKDGIDVSGDGDGDIRVTGNRIRGTAYDSGIFVDLSDGTVIRGNDLRGLEAPLGDVHLTSTTRNIVVVEPGDTVLDEGINNDVR